jgi:hypothetical protein
MAGAVAELKTEEASQRVTAKNSAVVGGEAAETATCNPLFEELIPRRRPLLFGLLLSPLPNADRAIETLVNRAPRLTRGGQGVSFSKSCGGPPAIHGSTRWQKPSSSSTVPLLLSGSSAWPLPDVMLLLGVGELL